MFEIVSHIVSQTKKKRNKKQTQESFNFLTLILLDGTQILSKKDDAMPRCKRVQFTQMQQKQAALLLKHIQLFRN